MKHHVSTRLTPPHPVVFLADTPVPELRVSPCQEMISNALDFCERKTRLQSREAVVAALNSGDRAIHDYFRYALAKELGSFLGHAEKSIKAVYLYEPEATFGENGEAKAGPVSSVQTIDLVIWSIGEKEGLRSLAQTIDEELGEGCRLLFGSTPGALRSRLRVDIVDDEDVRKRIGSGALLASIHTQPIKVWSRFVIQLNPEFCGQCLICASVCPYEAIAVSPEGTVAKIDVEKCQVCGICYSACPAGAIQSAYFDFASLARDVQSSVRATGFKTIALTCRGSTPPAEEIEQIMGGPDYVPICLPCVGRMPPDFFLKALSMGIEQIAVIPCKDNHCRFEDGSRIVRNRMLLLRSLLKDLHYDPNVLLFREAEGATAATDLALCTGCGTCLSVCPYGAIQAVSQDGKVLFVTEIDPALCQGCGACVAACPSKAIALSRFSDLQIAAQVESALARAPVNGTPRIVSFRCNWCTYDDDSSPYDRLHNSSQNVEIIRVPCVGRIDPLHVLWAFVNGADGVFLGGCPPDDCRYVLGSGRADQRVAILRNLLKAYGFDSRRLRLEHVNRDTPEAFGDALKSFVSEIRQLGSVSTC